MVLYRLRQFYRMPRPDRGLLLLIAIMVPVIEIGLRVAGFKRICSCLRHVAKTTRLTENSAAEIERHRRLLFLFHQQLPFAGGCLARALTLWCLLQRKGIDTDLRFGLRRDDGALAAHAWVEHQGQPLTIDRQVHERYCAFAGSILSQSQI